MLSVLPFKNRATLKNHRNSTIYFSLISLFYFNTFISESILLQNTYDKSKDTGP